MDRTEIQRMRDKMVREWEALRVAIMSLDALLEMAALESAAPQKTRANSSGQPKGAEAIYLVLKDAPGVEMDGKAILEELTSRGWAPNSKWPENAVSSNAARTVDMPGVTRRRSGVSFLYRYDDPGSATAFGPLQTMVNAIAMNGHAEEVTA